MIILSRWDAKTHGTGYFREKRMCEMKSKGRGMV